MATKKPAKSNAKQSGGGVIERGEPRKLQLPGAEGPVTDGSDVLEREIDGNRTARREPAKPETISMSDNEDEQLEKESA